MALIRHVDLPQNCKRVVNGPVAGGTFWALARANDLPPGPKAYADVPFLLKNGTLWVTDAQASRPWQQVTTLPKFTRQGVDDYDACSSGIVVTPYLPQFYWVPSNVRGARFLKRAHYRALAKWRKP